MSSGQDYYLSAMAEAYLECAAWSSSDDDGNDLEGGEFAEDAQQTALDDCHAFISYCDDRGIAINDAGTASQVGHDFWLTRNGHGAGFWDRGLGKLGEQLTDAAESFGYTTLYARTDGLLDFE